MKRIAYCGSALLALAVLGTAPAVAAGCQLGSNGQQIKHIVYLQFDNVHLRRDNPNVPSDLEQIPSLLNFLTSQGALLTNHHTPLISHTSVDILTSLTGVYGEKMGIPIGNTILYFVNNGATANFTSSFAYWTDNLGTTSVPQMVDQRGKIHPAPWVPFTRAGCDVGAFSTANIEFENTTSDINNVFGPTSPEHNENVANHTLAVADFEGIALHCAQGPTSLCASRFAHSAPDNLPDEPQPNGTGTGGYVGYQALFGNKYLAPALNNSTSIVINDLDGNPIADSHGNPGFPGFDPTPSQTLGYAAKMLEAGVGVVYLYIEDAHDNHNYPDAPISNDPDGTFGPGEQDYVAQLKDYDKAFSKFFARLAADGITKDNTLFVVTADENDHFAGSVARAQPPGCDGVNTPCTYPPPTKGEIDVDLSSVLLGEFNNTTVINIDFDDAPAIWINGNPAQTAAATRKLEQQAGALTGFDPITGGVNSMTQAMADDAEQHLLHMVTSDPNRTPNFILFGNPDYFLSTDPNSGQPSSCTAVAGPCFQQDRDFAWNHGDFQKDIVHTWLGIVGPGVKATGAIGSIFTDHTDIRPTILSLAHLKDDYAHDGRVIFEVLENAGLPDSLRAHRETLSRLAEAYKAINAPTGKVGLTTLTGISTRALKSSDPSDATYTALEEQIVDLTQRRNAIAGQMIAMLEDAAFNGKEIDEQQAKGLIDQAEDLLAETTD
jgi:arylsulfatase A-like enzyme